MSRRSRASRLQQHAHCDSCYSRRCRARVEASVCCAVAPCRLHCGALFHLCKEEDHLLLCPNVRVPCLNAGYGCPVQLPRSSQAAHLQLCPASVVCCSMEWNRWPTHDAHSYPNPELHENLIREKEQGGSLDLAMALKDQDRLFHSMKMKNLFPELIQSVKEEQEREERERREEVRRRKEEKKASLEKEAAERQASAHTWESFSMLTVQDEDEDEGDEEAAEAETHRVLTQEEREALARARGVDASLLENYNMWESMFSMAMGGCREAGEEAEGGRGRGAAKGKSKGLAAPVEEDAKDACAGATASNTGKHTHVHTSSSSSSSSSSSNKLKIKSFVYECVEPMKIITVRTFKVPTSFSAKQGRIRNPGFYKRESRAVDTSDLGVKEMPVWEEIQASLLCSLERELRGHLIAESTCTDALLQDEGTQTYSFLSAPFQRNTSLADLTAGKPLELHLQLQVEAVTSRHHKASSAFTFLCGHTFQRREYGKHYRNVHSDIQMGVNGWFEQRCPLAYLGCTYSQRRFQPSTQASSVAYNESLGCLSLRALGDASQLSRSSADSFGGGEEASLGSLPFEVLCHMASFLDSLSLSQLALVSRLMRQVCSTLLEDRGMVSLCWERTSDSHGGARWRVKHRVWQFSTLFSAVDTWSFRDTPSISEHLKVCPYYITESRTDKVRLPRMREVVQTNARCKGPTLVDLLQQRRIMM